jgi:hypothetical protein
MARPVLSMLGNRQFLIIYLGGKYVTHLVVCVCLEDYSLQVE